MSNQTTEKVQFGAPSLKRAEQSQVTQRQILTLMLTTHHSTGLFQTAFYDQPIQTGVLIKHSCSQDYCMIVHDQETKFEQIYTDNIQDRTLLVITLIQSIENGIGFNLFMIMSRICHWWPIG